MTPQIIETDHASRRGLRRGLAVTAVVLAILAGGAVFCRGVFNFDIFWQLGCGEWMAEHGRVLRENFFATPPEGDRPWLNANWLFELLVTGLYSLGGFELLTLFKVAAGMGVLTILAVSLRREVPASWLVICLLLATAAMARRVRVRPEVLTLVFLTVFVVVLESVRRSGRPNRLWVLVPLQLLWANMHGLFILGPAVCAAALLGEAFTRAFRRREVRPNLLRVKAVAPLLVMLAACLITPWPGRSLVHPLLLWSRISGEGWMYSAGVTELEPTWGELGQFPFVVALTGIAAIAMLANWRHTPIGHWLWLIAFVLLAGMARRNVGLLGPVLGYLAARHGGQALHRLRVPKWLPGFQAATSTGVTVLAMAVLLGALTGGLYRPLSLSWQSGWGLDESNYPLESARLLSRQQLTGGVFCGNFGDGSTFVYFSGPRGEPQRRVYLDGRLEAYSSERFLDHARLNEKLDRLAQADSVALPGDLRFFFISHDRPEQLRVLMTSDRFRLRHVEPRGALFVRTDIVDAPTAESDNLDQLDMPMQPAEQVAEELRRERGWWTLNPQTPLMQLGQVLRNLGGFDGDEPKGRTPPERARCCLLAIRVLRRVRIGDYLEPTMADGLLGQAWLQWHFHTFTRRDADLPLHPAASRAVYLFLRAIRDADAETVHRFGPQAVEVLLRSGEVEAARDMIERVLSEPAPADRADQAERLRRLAGELDVGLARAEAEIARYRRREGSPPRLAALMATPALGMTPSAIELLEAHRGSLGDSDLRLLGDMYLRLGLPEAARPNFEQIARNSPGEAQRPEIRLRLALCDAVEGEFFRAEERLRADDDEPMPANLHYTRAAILEILGRYEQALAALDAMEGNQTGVNIERVAGRLRRRLMSYLGSDSSPSGGREGF